MTKVKVMGRSNISIRHICETEEEYDNALKFFDGYCESYFEYDEQEQSFEEAADKFLDRFFSINPQYSNFYYEIEKIA